MAPARADLGWVSDRFSRSASFIPPRCPGRGRAARTLIMMETTRRRLTAPGYIAAVVTSPGGCGSGRCSTSATGCWVAAVGLTVARRRGGDSPSGARLIRLPRVGDPCHRVLLGTAHADLHLAPANTAMAWFRRQPSWGSRGSARFSPPRWWLPRCGSHRRAINWGAGLGGLEHPSCAAPSGSGG